MDEKPILFSGSSNLKLATDVCQELHVDLGRMHLSQFPDGETHVQILEFVQNRDVFVMQSIAVMPNHYLFEMLIMIDALKRASARSITAIIPYFGYCRQDRKDKPGMPITAKLVANLLATAGITNLITLDLHTDQVEGFFEIPVDHLHCQQLLYDTCKQQNEENYIVVAPDVGSMKIAENMARLLNAELAIIKKERLSDCEVNMTLIGDVNNKSVLIRDDLCSTAGTLVAAANLCQQQGAKKIIGTITHGLFARDALSRITSSALDYLFTTDTIQSRSAFPALIKTVSVASLIAESMKKSLIKACSRSSIA